MSPPETLMTPSEFDSYTDLLNSSPSPSPSPTEKQVDFDKDARNELFKVHHSCAYLEAHVFRQVATIPVIGYSVVGDWEEGRGAAVQDSVVDTYSDQEHVPNDDAMDIGEEGGDEAAELFKQFTNPGTVEDGMHQVGARMMDVDRSMQTTEDSLSSYSDNCLDEWSPGNSSRSSRDKFSDGGEFADNFNLLQMDTATTEPSPSSPPSSSTRGSTSPASPASSSSSFKKKTQRRPRLPPPDQKGDFECKICESQYMRRFERKGELTKHMKSHERPFLCEEAECRKDFTSDKDLKRHQNEQHNNDKVMYRCKYEGCPTNYSSPRESNTKKHMETVHGWYYERSRTFKHKKEPEPKQAKKMGRPRKPIPANKGMAPATKG